VKGAIGANGRVYVWRNFDPATAVNDVLPDISLPANEALGAVVVANGAQVMLVVSNRFGDDLLVWDDVATVADDADPDLTVGGFGVLDHPAGMAVDPATGKFYVVDGGKQRVLFYDAIPAVDTPQPSGLFGQPTLATSTPNAAGVTARALWTLKDFGNSFEQKGGAAGVAVTTIAGQRYLFIADEMNNRVLRVPVP
jgi:hypothetical protein